MAKLSISEKKYAIEQLENLYDQKREKYKEELGASQAYFNYNSRRYESRWEPIQPREDREKIAFKKGEYSVIFKNKSMCIVLDSDNTYEKELKKLEKLVEANNIKLDKQLQGHIDKLMLGSAEEVLDLLQQLRSK